jgi:hypothetical protein
VEDKYLVPLESAYTLAAWLVYGPEARSGGHFPHLDRLVKTATDQAVARRSESHTVYTVFVTLLSLETHDKVSARNVPHADTLVERPGSNETVVRRNGNSSDSVLDGEVCDLLISLKIPQTDTPVTAARSNDLTIAGKVKGIDVLLVTSELVLDLAAVDIPDL